MYNIYRKINRERTDFQYLLCDVLIGNAQSAWCSKADMDLGFLYSKKIRPHNLATFSTSRQVGKSSVVSLFLASVFGNISGCEVIIIAQVKTNVGSILNDIKAYIQSGFPDIVLNVSNINEINFMKPGAKKLNRITIKSDKPVFFFFFFLKN